MENDHLAPLKGLIARQWQAHGRETPIEGLLLASVTAPTGPIDAVYRPSLCVVAQGAKTSMLGDRAYRYDAGKCLIASMEVPVRAEITRATPDQPYLAFSLALDPATISDLLLGRDGTDDAPAAAALAVHALRPEQLRLQEARRLLLSDSADVVRIGYAIGYESPSQFSREYRRRGGMDGRSAGASPRRPRDEGGRRHGAESGLTDCSMATLANQPFGRTAAR